MIIKRKICQVFKNLSEGNFEAILKDFNSQFVHTFPGQHALGGKRVDVPAMRHWFQRLNILFPNLQFEIKYILVEGWPWNTIIAVKWGDRATLIDGQAYENEGIHFIRLRWGRLVELHAYLDSQRIVKALQHLANLGLNEASAAPIGESFHGIQDAK